MTRTKLLKLLPVLFVPTLYPLDSTTFSLQRQCSFNQPRKIFGESKPQPRTHSLSLNVMLQDNVNMNLNSFAKCTHTVQLRKDASVVYRGKYLLQKFGLENSI